MKQLVLLAVVLPVLACASSQARSKVVEQASFDHHCPKDKVVVVEEHTDIWAYRLNVCGEDKQYRDRGGDKTFQFVDVTSE